MPEPSSSDPWSSLADMLGVDSSMTPPASPPPTVSETTPAPQPFRPKSPAPPKPRPAANWGDIAGQLGVDVPPQPPPATPPPPKAGGPPQIESLVRGITGQEGGRAERPQTRSREADDASGYERPARGSAERDDRPYGRERGHGREQGRRGEQGRGRDHGRGRGRDDRGGGRGRRDERGRGGRERTRQTRGYRDDDRRDARRDMRDDRAASERGYDERTDDERLDSDRDEVETHGMGYDEDLSLPAGEQVSPFEARPIELDDSGLRARDSRADFSDEPAEEDFADADVNDLQDRARDSGQGESPAPSRRRRRRRGRRGVLREDTFLGIDRLATEDIAGHQPTTAEDRMEEEAEDRDELPLSEEVSAIEVGDDEGDEDQATAREPETQRKRRRRRRRGRGSKERSADSTRALASADEEDDDETLFPDREPRPHRLDEKRRDESADDEDEFDAHEDAARPSKNLHREVTPWAEAIGFIVSANMEARAKSPAGGGQRGARWGKGERRN